MHKEEINGKNCTLVSNPKALTELSLVITTAANTGKFDFLFLDSMNTLLIYNDLKTSEKFIHFLITNLRKANVGGIIFHTEQESADEMFIAVTQFCDGIIMLKDKLE